MQICSMVPRKKPLHAVAHNVANLQKAKNDETWDEFDKRRVIWQIDSIFCLFWDDIKS